MKLEHEPSAGKAGLRTQVPVEPAVFPQTVLATDRLLLRPFEARDAEDVQAACSDELIQAWLPLPRPYTVEIAREWCTRTAPQLLASGEGIQFAMVPRDRGRLVGCVGLKKTDWRARMSEIGYWISPWARGRGYAAEAVRAVGRWLVGDLGFERLELKAATGNVASQRVAELSGLLREGIHRNAGFVRGGRVDLVMYSLVSGDPGLPTKDGSPLYAKRIGVSGAKPVASGPNSSGTNI